MKYRVKRFSKREEQIAHNRRVNSEYIRDAEKLEKTELGKRVNQKWKKYNDLVEDYAKNSKYTKEDRKEGRKAVMFNLHQAKLALTLNPKGKFKYTLKDRINGTLGNIKNTGYAYRTARDSSRYTRIDNKLRHLSPENDPESIKQQKLMDKLREKYESKYVKVDPQ